MNSLIMANFEGENFGDLSNLPMCYPASVFHYTVLADDDMDDLL